MSISQLSMYAHVIIRLLNCVSLAFHAGWIEHGNKMRNNMATRQVLTGHYHDTLYCLFVAAVCCYDAIDRQANWLTDRQTEHAETCSDITHSFVAINNLMFSSSQLTVISCF